METGYNTVRETRARISSEILLYPRHDKIQLLIFPLLSGRFVSFLNRGSRFTRIGVSNPGNGEESITEEKKPLKSLTRRWFITFFKDISRWSKLLLLNLFRDHRSLNRVGVRLSIPTLFVFGKLTLKLLFIPLFIYLFYFLTCILTCIAIKGKRALVSRSFEANININGN